MRDEVNIVPIRGGRETVPLCSPPCTLSSPSSPASPRPYLSGFFEGTQRGRKILSSLSTLMCAVKLRLCVVGAVIGGPPVAMLFMSTPQSRLAPCQLPVKGSLLVRFTSLHIKPALKGEVANVVSRRGYKAAYGSLFITTHQSRLTPRHFPRKRWRLLVTVLFSFHLHIFYDLRII